MPSFRRDDVEIAFLDEGEGEPIVLVHGFGSNKEVNWWETRWVATLTRVRRRVIAPDMRGHGASTKFYDPAAYHTSVMAEDVRALLDHLGLGWADILGYSMGARVAAFLALADPERVRSAILGGLGIRLVESAGLPENVAEALEAPSAADLADPKARIYREFAEETGSDFAALAACIRGSRQSLTRAEAARIGVPSWSRSGPRTKSRAPRRTGGTDPRRAGRRYSRRDHMRAVGDRVFKQAVLQFLGERP